MGITPEEIKALEDIKSKVQNYADINIEGIEEIIQYIAQEKNKEIDEDIELEINYDDGGVVKEEKTEEGKRHVQIGIGSMADIKENKYLGLDADLVQERKEFIEATLQTFHELRHVKQYKDIHEPVINDDTIAMTRERIINDAFPGYNNRFNYENSLMEIDAMKTSLEDTVNFFEQMESDITPEEVIAVMKEKELSLLDYDLDDFGLTYEDALQHFEEIYNNPTEIKGIEELISELPEDMKAVLQTDCKEMFDIYNSETNIQNKLDILKDISLTLYPELEDKYPMAIQNKTNELQSEQSSKTQDKETNIRTISDIEKEVQTYYDDTLTYSQVTSYLQQELKSIYDGRMDSSVVDSVIEAYIEEKGFEGVQDFKEIVGSLDDIAKIRKEMNNSQQPNPQTTQNVRLADESEHIEFSELNTAKKEAEARQLDNDELYDATAFGDSEINQDDELDIEDKKVLTYGDATSLDSDLPFEKEVNQFFQERSAGKRLGLNTLGKGVVIPTQDKTAEKNAIGGFEKRNIERFTEKTRRVM